MTRNRPGPDTPLSPAATDDRLASRPAGKAVAARPGVLKSRASATGASAIGASSVGALALISVGVGAFAIGAIAVGAIAVGRLNIGKARFRKLRIDELEVGRLIRLEDGAPFEPGSGPG